MNSVIATCAVLFFSLTGGAEDEVGLQVRYCSTPAAVSTRGQTVNGFSLVGPAAAPRRYCWPTREGGLAELQRLALSGRLRNWSIRRRSSWAPSNRLYTHDRAGILTREQSAPFIFLFW
jgi:hypothetical protein